MAFGVSSLPLPISPDTRSIRDPTPRDVQCTDAFQSHESLVPRLQFSCSHSIVSKSVAGGIASVKTKAISLSAKPVPWQGVEQCGMDLECHGGE